MIWKIFCTFLSLPTLFLLSSVYHDLAIQDLSDGNAHVMGARLFIGTCFITMAISILIMWFKL